MRVAYVTATVVPTDGWGRYARQLVAAAPAAGIEPVLVTSRHGGGDASISVEHHRLLPTLLAGRCTLARSLAHAGTLRRVVATCDLVHGLVEPWLPLVAAATPRRLPLVQTAHGSWSVLPLRRPVVGRVFARALARTDLLVCQSRITRDALLAVAAPPRCEVLSGGVDPSAFAPPPGLPPPGWPSSGRVLLSVGALKPRKGHHVALETFARLAADHPDLHWVVVGGRSGTGPYGDQLRRRVGELRLTHRVCWLFDLTDRQLAGCYLRASVFLLLPVQHLGAFEGLGLVYLEAAAAGVAAVGTLGSGAEDAIADGETGILVPPDDPEAAAGAVDRLLRDPSSAARLGAAGRDRADVLSWTNLTRSLAARYRELMELRRMSPRGRERRP